jgi:hypothetical protein
VSSPKRMAFCAPRPCSACRESITSSTQVTSASFSGHRGARQQRSRPLGARNPGDGRASRGRRVHLRAARHSRNRYRSGRRPDGGRHRPGTRTSHGYHTRTRCAGAR